MPDRPPSGDPAFAAGLHALFDEMFEGVQVIDHDHRYIYLNAAAAAHARRPVEELVGQRMQDMYPGIERTEMFGRIEACLRDRAPQQMLNEFTYPDGRTGWFDLRFQPVAQGVLVLSIDVTRRQETEIELRRKDREKSAFLDMLAHELRNPLAPIRNGLHVLIAGVAGADEGTRRAAEMMDRQVRHLIRLVDGLLDATRLEHGKIRLGRERLDLRALVRNAVADRSGLFDELGVGLNATTPETPVWVDGDETRLAQVLANVLDNAGKFTPSGGMVTVTLSIRDERGRATVTVADTGVGIAADVLPGVFDALRQADTSLDRTPGGLGIGLAVARGLIELHGGTIEARSPGLDRGTTIRIVLPREPEPAALESRESGPSADPQKARVLIIEDNRDAADSLAMILDLWGYEVDLAYNGTDGIVRARATPPDIVLCDIGLPGVDGYAVARSLRGERATASARLIAITGYGAAQDRARTSAAGFDIHLVKPVNPDALRQHLRAS